MVALNAQTLLLAALAALLLLYLIEPVISVTAFFPKNLNEGWNALHAARAVRGLPLYPEAEGLFINNYPPLSFYLVGGVGAVIGDYIVAGRLVSLLAFAAIAANVVLITRLLGTRWPAALVAGLVFVLGLLSLRADYVGMNDPQMLAQALMSLGLVVLLRRGGTGGHVAAAGLMVAAGLVKHNLIVLPIAVTLWLLLTDRDALRSWLRASAAVLAVTLVGLWALYGGALFESLTSSRTYSAVQALVATRVALESLRLPVLAGLILVGLGSATREVRLVALYAGLALVIGGVLAGGHGVNQNIFFDLLIALAVASGLLYERIDGWRAPLAWRARLRHTFVLVLLFEAAVAPSADLLGWLKPGHAMAQQTLEADTRADVAYLRQLPGPAVCQRPALCYWAGKELEVDFFTARQAFVSGDLDEQRLLAQVAAREFAVIQLAGERAISPAFMAALACAYEVDRTSLHGTYFTPRAAARC